MLRRVLPLSLMALAVVLFASAPAWAADDKADSNTHEGKFVSADGNKFTMTDKAGARHTHTLAIDATVTCDGKTCKLSDLREGTMVRVTTEKDNKEVAVKVDARTKDALDKNK